MRNASPVFVVFAAGIFCLVSLVSLAGDISPETMIEQVTDKVLAELKRDHATLEAHPGRIYNLIEKDILPHFDFSRMSRWVLARYWREANSQQRSEFQHQFQDLLVNTYGSTLLNYSGQTVSYLPTKSDPGSGIVIVRTQLHDAGSGKSIPIDYQLYNDQGQWKVFDLSVDGVNLVTNYRESFATQIQHEGLDGLIHNLTEHNKQLSQ